MTDHRSAAQVGAGPFSLLVVCTGNICRSPLAEQLLRSRLGEAGLHSSTVVASAGLGAVVGADMDKTAAAISSRLNGRPEGFRARQLRSSIVNDADLILTMTREQRDDLVHRYPRALQRTFALTEFAKLLSLGSSGSSPVEALPPSAQTRLLSPTDIGDLAEALRGQTRALARIRSRARLTAADDIADPYRQTAEVHEAVAQQISLASSVIVHNIVAWAVEAQGTEPLQA